MSKYKEYFAIESKLKKQGFDIERSDLIRQATNGKKIGLSQLSDWEYSELIRFLNSKFPVNNSNNAINRNPTIDPAEDRQRKKIIALLVKIGFSKDGKADMMRINHWCITHGHLHTKLNSYRGIDLAKLVTQAENYYKSTIERL